MSLTIEAKDALRKEQQEKDRRSNCKQHCTKISEKLDKLPPNASSRAIWELIQNARDLSENCEIVLTLKSDEFIFQHNGKPFNYDSLSSLVKQVSSEEKEGEDTVGQYGTGFVTTHCFSKIIYIDGYYQVGNEYIKLDNFKIDREFNSIDEFIVKMSSQLKEVEDLVDRSTVTEKEDVTRLKYQLNENSLPKAQKGFEDAKVVIPYVLILNPRIKQITLQDEINNFVVTYSKRASDKPNWFTITEILNGVESDIDFYYLNSVNGLNDKDIIIIPFSKQRNYEYKTPIDALPKQFLFFPLLGTEDFGMNFIFHSSRFIPKEERDGIFLPNTNDNTKAKYEKNVMVLNEMSDRLFDWLDRNIQVFNNPIVIAPITFGSSDDEFTKNFLKDFKSKWVSKFVTLPLIETDNGRVSIAEKKVKVLDSDILSYLIKEEDIAKYLPIIYKYASFVSQLPKREEVLEWSKIINDWGIDDKEYFVSLDDIALKVSEDSGDLLTFLEFLKGCGKSEMFNKYPLIPNREGRLRKANELRNASEIVPELYDVVKAIVPKSAESFVDNAFADIVEYSTYSRIDMRKDVSSEIEQQRKFTISAKHKRCLDSDFEAKLISYCSVFNVENSDSVRMKLMPLICKKCGVDFVYKYVAKINSDEADWYSTGFNTLVESQMIKYDSTILDNEEDLKFLSSFISNCTTDVLQEKLQIYNLFPNYNNKLCKYTSLLINENNTIDDGLLDIYERATSTDLKEKLVSEEFKSYMQFGKKTALDVAKEIEEILFKDENTNLIIEIIEKLENPASKWKDYFRDIEKNKEELFFKSVKGDSKKNVYKLMKKDSKTLEMLADLTEKPRTLKLLAELSNEENLEWLLLLAKQKVQEEKHKRDDFEFKYKVGTHIQGLIQNKVADELSSNVKVRIEDNQDGQDMIVYLDDSPIYYIEVKAKWNFSEPAHMSKNQMKKAVKNSDDYSLVCVDLTDEDDRFYPEIGSIIDKIYVHSKIGVDLSPIMDGVVNTDLQNDEDVIKMGGNYQCNIPKKIFVKGEPFDKLIDIIVGKISSK